MVKNPEDHVEWFKNMGIHNLTFHWEATDHHDRLINEIKSHYPSVGISLNPSNSIDLIPDYILEKIDLVLIMSVNPGFGGQSFLPYSLEKIKNLNERRKHLNASFMIQVDGGVSDKNAKELISSGADNLVAGSYIFSSNDYIKQIHSLR
jgi:ribulose-phosphate 3-epimerase